MVVLLPTAKELLDSWPFGLLAWRLVHSEYPTPALHSKSREANAVVSAIRTNDFLVIHFEFFIKFSCGLLLLWGYALFYAKQNTSTLVRKISKKGGNDEWI